MYVATLSNNKVTSVSPSAKGNNSWSSMSIQSAGLHDASIKSWRFNLIQFASIENYHDVFPQHRSS